MYKNISAQEAYNLIKHNEGKTNFAVLDVRTAGEYMEERIDDALNLDLYADSFEKQLEGLDKNKEYIIYCENGNRSEIVSQMMVKLGFEKVSNMADGIEGWQGAGLETKK